MPTAVLLEGLSKAYVSGPPWKRKTVTALKQVSLEVPEGGVFGLLGLNGAGKTTTVKILLGLLRPSSGRTEVLGGSIRERSIRSCVGYLPELPYFSRQLTAHETLRHFGALYGFSGKELEDRVQEMLELVRLAPASHQRVSEFSKGMQQRLGIGQALIGKPRLFLCDEPMSGLDPVGNREMRDIFLDLRRTGTTVFMNTHILDEVERICDRVAVLHEGRLAADATIAEVLSSRTRVPTTLDLPAGTSIPAWKMEGTRLDGNTLTVTEADLQTVLAALAEQGVRPASIRPQSSILEAWFLGIVGAVREGRESS